MSLLATDLRYAFRSLRKSPVFTAVALASLALGIGANTAIFSLMDQVMLRRLPVKDPQELVMLNMRPVFGRVQGENTFSYPMYRELRDRNQVFSGLVARFNTPAAMSYKGATERVSSDLVTGNFFPVLGVAPALGRLLTPDDDRARAGHPVVVLTHGYWTRRFGASPGILNQAIRLNGTPMTVIGVAPPGFYGLEVGNAPDVIVPVMMKPVMTPDWDDLDNQRSMWLTLAARLKPGIEMRQAEASLGPLLRALLEAELARVPNVRPYLRERFLANKISLVAGARGASQVRSQFSTPLLMLMGMVGLVLLIACANVANLLVARAAARQRDIAIRLALGAGRGGIFRQLLVESLVLSLAGGVLGLLAAGWTASLLLRFLPDQAVAQSLSTDPDLRVMAFAMALSLVTGLLFGLAPAWQATRASLAATLKDEAASNVSAGAGHLRFRLGLVVTQVALSLMLLIGAGLFATSLYHLRSLDPGFRITNILTFAVDPQLNGYPQQRVRDFYSQLEKNMAGVPGVQRAALAEMPVLEEMRAMMTVSVEGYQAKDGENMNPSFNWVGPGYFDVLGIPRLAGREFDARDVAGSPHVVIINQAMARQYFGDRNPLGRHLYTGGAIHPKIEHEIVGVVKDLKPDELREKAPRMVFIPYSQDSEVGRMTVYARTSGDPLRLAAALRREVARLDADLPVFDLRTLETVFDNSIFVDRLIAVLASFFGLLATLLAAIGLYGVMAYAVTRRTRELGVRIALGAGTSDILWMVLREAAIMVGLGILIALPAARALARTIESQLYGVKAGDPLVYGGATLVLAVVALAAGLIPALRATRVDPVVALRYE